MNTGGLPHWHHAPPAGARSGVADYAETLNRALTPLGVPNIDLYHLGNNGLHAAIYRKALKKPGVIVLHDAVLHHFLLGQLTREQYISEFVYNYGVWRRDVAADLWEFRASSGTDPRYFEFPMLRRILETARGVIVHNEGAACMAADHGPARTPVHIVPHFFEPPPPQDAAEAVWFRERLDIPQGATLFGIFGYLRETKRIVPAIHAFRRLHAARPRTALLIAGSAASPDLDRLIETERAHPAIRRIPHLSERDLTTAAASVDACINLRYPGAGETSGISMRLMGLGKPVIVTSGPENADLPSGAVLRVTPGIAESAELFDHMVMLAEFPNLARDVGSLAQRHILARHSLEAVARQYWQVLCAGF